VAPLPTGYLEKDYSTLHVDAGGNLLRLSLSSTDKYRLKLPLTAMSGELVKGFVTFEDKYFFRHPGVNPWSLVRAAARNARSGRVVCGGSTLTMQLAKLMEPKRRTVGAKVFEMVRAVQLELMYSKNEILEMYLNSVPMGGNIEGVGAASYLYFGKNPRSLSPAEAALLVAIPKAPGRLRPDRYPERAEAQRRRVFARVSGGRAAPPLTTFPAGRFPNPHGAPHLLARMRGVGSPVKRYLLDPDVQEFCEAGLARAVGRLRGVRNGAVMVVDNKTMAVLGYVGSPDFGDGRGGQVNGAAVLRSPGSLLKPFLYALAVDRGVVTPRRVVYDIERNYDGYVPSNFERTYAGPVPAWEALTRSLNIPAVNLEFELTGEGLAALLRRAHLEGPGRRVDQAGLSAALGAHPLTLEELVGLYAALADGGRRRPLRFMAGEAPAGGGNRLFSPEAAYIVLKMLGEGLRPDLPQAWEFTPSRGRVAFKTGTSFGLRDAWCLGVDPRFTVGVWMGNVDATGSSALVGSRAAAPLVVEIFNHLSRYEDAWFAPPQGVRTRDVCAVTGEALGPHCPARAEDDFIPGVSDAVPCRVHQAVAVRRADGKEVCPSCMAGRRREYGTRVVEMWPPAVARFLRDTGRWSSPWPEHNPLCRAVDRAGGLRIDCPRPGGAYAVTAAIPADRQKIPLRAQSRRPEERVQWYVDGRPVAEGLSTEVFYFTPSPGQHEVEVVGARGAFDKTWFRVRS
jgi:penicillin-binding protein 1C